MQPSDVQTQIHRRALSLSGARRRADGELVRAIRDVYEANAHRAHGQSTLFKYCVRELGLCEWEAYAFGSVAKKSSRVSALAEVVESGRLPLSKAARIVSVLTDANAADLVSFAVERSTDEINREVARRNPKAARRARTKHLADGLAELVSAISAQAVTKLERVRSLEAQRGRSSEIKSGRKSHDAILRNGPFPSASPTLRLALRLRTRTQNSVDTENRGANPARLRRITPSCCETEASALTSISSAGVAAAIVTSTFTTSFRSAKVERTIRAT